MKRIDDGLREYREHHRNPVNQIIHRVCIPLILFSSLGMLWPVPIPEIGTILPMPFAAFLNLSTLVGLVTLALYLRLSVALFVGMSLLFALFSTTLYALDLWCPIPLFAISIALFAIAWVGQFVGHQIEGKKPSFFDDVQFLLIGPAWVLDPVYRKLGIPMR